MGEAGSGDGGVKALTLHQPWASLLVAGIKRNETRSWATSHRGPLAIHAAKLSASDLLRRIGDDEYVRLGKLCHLMGLGWIPGLPRGCIVGTVDVVDCLPIGLDWTGRCRALLDGKGNELVDDREESLGDYTPGRYAWVGAHHKALSEPITCQGRQGLWTVSSVEAAVLAGEGAIA